MVSRFSLSSPSLEGLMQIAMEHTCEGNNTPPQLSWSHPPPGTRSFVLTMEDLDARTGPATHWLIWDIPVVMEPLDPVQLEGLGVVGSNDFHALGYHGPCPRRSGSEHRYLFRLSALAVDSLDVEPGAYRPAVERAMDGYVLGTAELIGRYARGPVTRPHHRHL